MIRTVIFDIGNVLIRFDWDGYIHRLFDDQTAQIITDAFWKTGYWYELDRGVLSDDEVLQLIISAAPDHEAKIREAFARVGECKYQFSYAIPWIKELKEAGYQVLFLSNYSTYLMQANWECLSFLAYMDGGIFSCKVKLLKPDLAIYEKICHTYDLDPAECLFIDDNAANIAGARAYGMQGIVFESYEQAYPLACQLLTAQTDKS